MVRNMVSKSGPDAFSSLSMSLLSIIPGMSECAEWSMPGIAEGTVLPQDFSHPLMVRISGSCAFSMRVARSLTLADEARPAASFAISRACWWCGIMPCAKDTSCALCAAAPDDDAEDGDEDEAEAWLSWPLLPLSLLPPQAARTSAAVM